MTLWPVGEKEALRKIMKKEVKTDDKAADTKRQEAKKTEKGRGGRTIRSASNLSDLTHLAHIPYLIV